MVGGYVERAQRSGSTAGRRSRSGRSCHDLTVESGELTPSEGQAQRRRGELRRRSRPHVHKLTLVGCQSARVPARGGDVQRRPTGTSLQSTAYSTLPVRDPSRSGSTCTCRSARCAAATATSTPTRPPSWAPSPEHRGLAGRMPRSPSSASPRRVLGDADAHREPRSSSAAERPPCCQPRDLGRDAARRSGHRVRARRRTRRSPPRPTRTVEPGSLPSCAGRLHPGLARHAAPRSTRAARPSTAPTTRAGPADVVGLGPTTPASSTSAST